MTYRTFDGTSQSETIVDGRFSSSGDIALADGTATQGAIYFADDKNTGIYSPSNDNIAFTTAGTEKVRVTNLGGLTLGGTNTDVSMGEFGGNTGGLTIDDAGVSHTGIRLSHGDDDTYIIQGGNTHTYFSKYGTGNLIFGVGASGQTALTLDSNQDATFTGNVFLANSKIIKFPGASTDPGASIKHQSGHFEINNDTGNLYFMTTGALYLRTNGNTDALTLDSSQNATFAGGVRHQFRNDANDNQRSTGSTANHWWKIGEFSGAGSDAVQIKLLGTSGYGSGANCGAENIINARVTNSNTLEGFWYTSTQGEAGIQAAAWKYTGANNKYEIWAKFGTFQSYAPIVDCSALDFTVFGTNTGETDLSNVDAAAVLFDTTFRLTADTGVQLGYANVTKLETVSTGAKVTGALSLNGDADQLLELNSTDNNAVYTAFLRNGTRKAYVGFGGSGSSLDFVNEQSDGDITITGNDGGSSINCLQFDVSEGGKATFADDVTTGPVCTVKSGTNGTSASLYIISNDGTTNGDGWRINSNQDVRDLTISNNESGSYVDKIPIEDDGDTTFAGNITVSNTKPTITLNDSNNESDYWIQNDDGVFAIKDLDTSGGIGRLTIAPNGVTTFSGNCDFSNGIDVTGDSTFSGNISVGGTTHGTSTSLRNIWLGATGHIYSEAAAGTGNSLSISQNAHVDSDGSWEYIHGDKASNMYLYNGTWGFRTAAAGVAGNDITWSETLKLNHDGNAEFSNNVVFNAGYGCHFGASTGSGSSSTVLDDYEEGTATLLFKDASDSLLNSATTYNKVSYTKVGNKVTLSGRIYFANNSTANNDITVSGLPFNNQSAVADQSLEYAYIRVIPHNWTYTADSLWLELVAGGSTGKIQVVKTDQAHNSYLHADAVNAVTYAVISGHYFTST